MADIWEGLDAEPVGATQTADPWEGLEAEPLPAPVPADRRRIQAMSGKVYEGLPEQIAGWRRRGGPPEASGLSLMARPKTTGEAVGETGIRLAAPIGGLLTGGPAGFVGGSMAAEEIIGAIDRATGQADAVTPIEGAAQGAGTGLLNLGLGYGAGIVGRGAGELAKRVVPGLQGPASFLGETGALAGYGAIETGSLNPTDIAIAAAGAGAPRALGGLKRLAAERRLAGATGPREVEVPGVSRQVFELERVRGERAPRVEEPPPRARDLEPTEIIEGYRPPQARVSAEDLGARPLLSPEDAELVQGHVARMRDTGEPGGGGGLLRDLEAGRSAAAGRHGEAVRRLGELEPPQSVGAEYRRMRESGEVIPGGGAFEKGGHFRPEIRGGKPSEPPELTARRTSPEGDEFSVAYADRRELMDIDPRAYGPTSERMKPGWYVYKRTPAGTWELQRDVGRGANESEAIKLMAKTMGMPKAPPVPRKVSEAERAQRLADKGNPERERQYLARLRESQRPSAEQLRIVKEWREIQAMPAEPAWKKRAAEEGIKERVEAVRGRFPELFEEGADLTPPPAPPPLPKPKNVKPLEPLPGDVEDLKVTMEATRARGMKSARPPRAKKPPSEEQVREAKRAWAAGEAYIDNAGNYHIRPPGEKSGKGPIAPWNKAAKQAFANVGELHRFAASGIRKRIEAAAFKSKAELVEALKEADIPGSEWKELHRLWVERSSRPKPASERPAHDVRWRYGVREHERPFTAEEVRAGQAGIPPKVAEFVKRGGAEEAKPPEVPPKVKEFVKPTERPAAQEAARELKKRLEPSGELPDRPEFTEGHIGGLAGARHMRAEGAKSPKSPKGPVETREIEDPDVVRKAVRTFKGKPFEVSTLKNADDEFPAGTLRTLRLTTKPPPGYKFKLEPGERDELHRTHNLLVAWELDEAGKYLGMQPRSFHLDEVLELVTPDGKRVRYVPKAKPKEAAQERAGEAAAKKPPPPEDYPQGVSEEDRALAWKLFPERLNDDGVDVNAGKRHEFLVDVEQFSSVRRAEDVRRTRRDLERGPAGELGEGQPATVPGERDRPGLGGIPRKGRRQSAEEIPGGKALEPRERRPVDEIPPKVREFVQGKEIGGGAPPEPRPRGHRGEEPAPRRIREPQRELGQGAEAREPRERLAGFGREQPVPRLPKKPPEEIGRGGKALEPIARGPRRPTQTQQRRLEELGRGPDPDALDIPGRIPAALKRHPAAVAGKGLEALGRGLELPSKALDKVIDQVFGPDSPRWVRGAAKVGGISGIFRGGAKLATGVAVPGIAGRGLQRGGKVLRRLAADPERRAKIRANAGRLKEAAKNYPALAGVAAYFTAKEREED